MNRRVPRVPVRLALIAIAGGLCGLALVPTWAGPPAPRATPRTAVAWRLDDALAQLDRYPNDPYLHYVALQLARREGRVDAVAKQVEQAVRSDSPAPEAGRRDRVDLLSIFTGALAVQESLQLDTMRQTTPRREAGPVERRAREMIDIARLTGPTIKGHPWEKMLGDRKPDVGQLAGLVPEDNYIVEFRSVTRMLDLLDNADLWGAHFLSQASNEAQTQQVGERMRRQLAIETNRLLRPLYDKVVEELAITGTDLAFGEGTDVTLIFRVKKPELLKARMDGFLVAALKSRRDARRDEGELHGVPYVSVTTPDRAVHVFSAYPEPNLHLRSNSREGLLRVLSAIKGKDLEGKPVRRLGESTEYAYVRTLMPRGAKEEDGFVYLSDPFIRRLVGPHLKLTERRRMLCYNHLRMIGHAALLYRTEFGKAPTSMDELVKTGCLPGKFNDGDFTCIDGGKYSLSADGSSGACSHHGHAHNLVPCCETPLAWVTGTEADEYDAFLREYNNYWRTYFDPIAVRVQVTPQHYRLETIVLPLINNTIYQALHDSLAGKPEPLDGLPVPRRNIFTVAGRFNKEGLLRQVVGGADPYGELDKVVAGAIGISADEAHKIGAGKAVAEGLGNQVAVHVYDAEQMFDLDLPEVLGITIASFNGRRRVLGNQDWALAVMIAALNAPVYVSLPVKDANIVDNFLERLDRGLAEEVRRNRNRGNRFLDLVEDCYRTKLKDGTPAYGLSLRLWAVKWRFFWARIGDGFYIATKASILEDLAAAKATPPDARAVAEAPAHGMVRLRARNWDQVLPEYRVGWAEKNRAACLKNLGPLASAARSVVAQGKDAEADLSATALATAQRLYAVHFYCPEGGTYKVSADGTTCTCSVHGNAESPRQPLAPAEAGGPGKALQNFAGLTATLTFLEDGLHAVFVVERKRDMAPRRLTTDYTDHTDSKNR